MKEQIVWGEIMIARLFGIVLILVLGACSSTGTLTTAFDADAAAFINTTGQAEVSGQAFLRRNDGIVVYGAGSEVLLIPKTAYSDERMQQIYGSGKISYFGRTFTNDDPDYYNYARTAIADGEGRFSFDNVAYGDYYLITTVTWMIQYAQQGGSLMERVSVRDGQDVSVIMRGY